MPKPAPADHTRPLPPPGTPVIRRAGGLRGVVQRYEPYPASVGTFPVRWRYTGLWETVGVNDVITMVESTNRSDVATGCRADPRGA